MTISHHLDDATLMRYAAGELSEAFAVVIASHLAMCEECRQAAFDAEGIGGELLGELSGTDTDVHAFDRLMTAIGNDVPPSAHISRADVADPDKDVPLPLQNYIGDHLEKAKWRTVAPGVKKCTIKTMESGSSLFMLRIGEGMEMPEHGHGGDEITLILTGAYRDAFGRFGPGDVADLDEHVEHTPKVEQGGACICLVATEAPTRFKGLIGKLMQPLVRI